MTCYVKLLSGDIMTLHDTENVYAALEQVHSTLENHRITLFRETTFEPLHPSDICQDQETLLVFYQPIYDYMMNTPEEGCQLYPLWYQMLPGLTEGRWWSAETLDKYLVEFLGLYRRIPESNRPDESMGWVMQDPTYCSLRDKRDKRDKRG